MSKTRFDERRLEFLLKIDRILQAAQQQGVSFEQAVQTLSQLPRTGFTEYAQLDAEFVENEDEKNRNLNTGGNSNIMNKKSKSVRELKILIKQLKKELKLKDIRVSGLNKSELLKLYNEISSQ